MQRRAPVDMSVLSDCGKCMKTQSLDTRRGLGCGYAPRDPLAMPWTPPLGSAGYDMGDDNERAPTVCVGYTVHLPQVIEVQLARAHWSKGQLQMFCDEPNDELLTAIVMLEGESNSAHRWASTPAKDGGGGG